MKKALLLTPVHLPTSAKSLPLFAMKNVTLTSALLAALATVTLASLRVYQSQPLYYYTYYSSSSSSPAKSLSPFRAAPLMYSHASPFARTLARSYRLADSLDSQRRQEAPQPQPPPQQQPQQQQPQQQQAEASVILLNDTSAVPFTTSNAALSTSEYEAAGPSASFEEGVGPATSFEPSDLINPLPVTSKIQYIASKGASPSKLDKVNSKSGKRKNSLYEPQVVYSDVHPVYVKPPVDFKPVVYPNRRLDGIRATDQLANQVTLLTPLAPYPFTFPRGVSSWSFGGPSAFNRGSYWESLATDEALHLPSGSNKKSLKHKKKTLLASPSKLNSAFVPLVIYPGASNTGNSAASVYQLPSSYQIQYHHSPSYSLWPESTVHFSTAASSSSSGSSSKSKKASTAPNRLSHSGSRRVNSPASNLKPLTSQTVKSPSYSSSSSSPSSSSSSSLDTQKTKLPVGLTSWFLGGVRDLNGKHWKLPELTVNGVDVVPLNTPAAGEATPDLMMTSDGEYEKVEPSVVDSTSLTETEKEAQPSVTFDDDSDFVNTLS